MSGTIPARLSSILQFKFVPMAPINYYKRVFVLVEHQAPVIIDVIVTAFDDEYRPAPLLPRHVAVILYNYVANFVLLIFFLCDSASRPHLLFRQAYHARCLLGEQYRLLTPETILQVFCSLHMHVNIIISRRYKTKALLLRLVKIYAKFCSKSHLMINE